MNIAVIFAGGSGQRMHTKDIPKQFLEMHRKPIIICLYGDKEVLTITYH